MRWKGLRARAVDFWAGGWALPVLQSGLGTGDTARQSPQNTTQRGPQSGRVLPPASTSRQRANTPQKAASCVVAKLMRISVLGLRAA